MGVVSGLLFLAQADPIGFGSPLGRVASLLAILAALVVLVRWWLQQRKR